MAEIRNLTRNGETFYPLTTSSAVINEATGEGLVIDDEPTAGSDNLAKSGGTYSFIKANTLEEKEHPIAEQNVVGYLTDKNKSIVAKLMSNGAVEWLVKNSRDVEIDALFEGVNEHFDNIEDFLSYVSSEVPDNGSGVIKYLTDKDGKVIATINNVGDAEFKGGGGFDGEVTKSRNIGFDAIKVLTDNKGSVIGWITSEGKIHIEELEVKNLDANITDSIPNWLQPLINVAANNENNRLYVNDENYDFLKNHKDIIIINGIKKSVRPTLLIHDDDTVDPQLPTSYIPNATPSTEPDGTAGGGYASLLLPVLIAFNKKFENQIKGKAVCGLAAEGQRIGLTPLYSMEDTFSGDLNNNGQIVKKIVEKEGWEVMCHSMTARYINNSYLVNGIDSEFANSLLIDATYSGTNGLGYSTTTCYDTVTNKNYKVKQDKAGWDECPLHYAKPYLAVSKASNSELVINPTYSVKYQVGTWFERAEISGISFLKSVGIRWGSSGSIWHTREAMKYADVMFDSDETYNYIPIDTTIGRIHYHPSASRNGITEHTSYYNAYNQVDYELLINAVDEAFEKDGLVVLTSHVNTNACQNKYWPTSYGFNYPTNTEPSAEGMLDYYDANYPEEWYVPLKYAELQDMLTNENSTYWTTPPQRLGIQSWADFYPCPGTTLAMLWDVLKYALNKGYYFGTSKEAIQDFGNKFAIGICIDQRGYYWGTTDNRLGNIPEENKSYFIAGADGSIRYYSH